MTREKEEEENGKSSLLGSLPLQRLDVLASFPYGRAGLPEGAVGVVLGGFGSSDTLAGSDNGRVLIVVGEVAA